MVVLQGALTGCRTQPGSELMLTSVIAACLSLELTGRGKAMQAAPDSRLMKAIQSTLRFNELLDGRLRDKERIMIKPNIFSLGVCSDHPNQGIVRNRLSQTN